MGVIRSRIREARDRYFVSYAPANALHDLASIDLVFPQQNLNPVEVSNAMEQEARAWIKRFPVPSIVFAFDAKEDLITIPDENCASFVTAYLEPQTGEVVTRWGSGLTFPTDQTTDEYKNRIYHELPSRDQEEIRQKATHNAQATARAAAVIVFFIAVVPTLIQIASLGIYWIGWALSLLSISKGLYRAAKLFGWVKPSEKQKRKEQEELAMRHHHYHCKLNRKGFERLKLENFEREAVERTRQEADEIRREKMKIDQSRSDF